MAEPEPHARARTPGIWIFVALDCTSFGLFFLVFMSERLGQAALFDRSAARLDTTIGLANTSILITSSWLVALGVSAVRSGAVARARILFLAALAVGALFGIAKLFEYGFDLHQGITVTTNEFYSLYFALTGVHFLHYLIGLGVLGVLVRMTGRDHAAQQVSADGPVGWIEGGALYWHMVDLLWVFLFAMLYLPGVR